MDLISLFVAVPKAALFFLLIVGGAIVAEIFYFGKKKEEKIPEISLPPASPTPTISEVALETPPLVETVSPTPTILSSPPPPPPVLPPKKSRLSKKAVATLLAVFLIVVSIPIVVGAIRLQRQETRKQAAGEQYPAGCCFNDELGEYRTCPTGQTCDIPNGACGPGGKSCNPEGSGFHKACVNNQCVNVPGAGADDCPNNCQAQATPTPPPGCDTGGGNCQNDDQCCSKVCHFAKCCPYDLCPNNCASFDEPVCHTHVNCHWEAGQCKDGALPTPGPGTCEINCSATQNGVSVTVKPGKEADCAVAQVTATWYASTCSGTSGWCSGPTQTKTQALPFSAGMMGHTGDCSWQADITASTDKGGACHDGNHGTLPCNTSTPTPSPTSTPTPTGTPSAYTAQCTDGRRVFAYPSWTPITNLATLTKGQTVYFATTGTTNAPGGITKARFRINNGVSVSWCNGAGRSVVGLWCELNASAKHGNDFYIQYTIPSAGSYTIESMVFNQSLGWW